MSEDGATKTVVRTAKHQQARDSLPDDLKPIFDTLVDDYRWKAAIRHGSPYVSYIVLADCIKLGWRKTAEEIT